MTTPPEVQARAIVAEFQEAVNRSARAMNVALDDLLSAVQRAADTLALRLREIAAEAGRVDDAPVPPRRPGHPRAGGVRKRTQARRVRLQELWAVQPRVSLDDIAADLNTIKPGTDLHRQDVSSWAHDLKLPRRIDSYAPPAEPVAGSTPPAPPAKLRAESPPVPSGTAVQPVEIRQEPESVAAAPMPPERLSPSARQAVPMPASTGSFGEAVMALLQPPVRSALPATAPARPAPVPSTDPVEADETYIRDWAAQRGIYVGRTLNIGQINARRRHLGLAPFADPADRRPDRAGAT